MPTRRSMHERPDSSPVGPLAGYRVLELGNLIAAPFGSRLFAEFGAEVIKVERPRTGDELRRWRLFAGDTSMFWYTMARNKLSITLDLRTARGQRLALDLARHCDVVMENFRPGTLERWNLGFDALREVNPDIILVRISGYGQTGPYRDRAGFGGVAEAIGGLRNLTGYPDRPPTRVGVSLGDQLAGMFGAIGALMSLLRRERDRLEGMAGDHSELVDVALYESVFATLEALVPEYDAYGVIRQRTGSSLPGVAPSNSYPCKDDKWVVIGGNSNAIFPRLMRALGRADLADDPELQDNPGRARRQEQLDAAIAAWTSQRTVDEVMATMEAAAVPAGPIYDAADIASDPHYRERDMLREHKVDIDGRARRVRFPGVVPKLIRRPGYIDHVGPRLGEHNQGVYTKLLGLSNEDLEQLAAEGII